MNEPMPMDEHEREIFQFGYEQGQAAAIEKRKLTEEEIEKIADILSDQLFKDGTGRRIDRLVAEYGPVQDGVSGWAQFGAKDLIKRILRGDGRTY